MTDSQPSDTPKNLEELSQAIDNLEKNLDSISRSQSSGRTTVLIGSLLLLAMIGFFGINLEAFFIGQNRASTIIHRPAAA